MIFLINRFSYSLKQQFVSEKKIYCVDNGIAESIAFKFSSNRGKYLENAVYMELRRRAGEIFYYKTKKGREVDFLVRKAGHGIQLFQVCAEMENSATKEREIEAIKQSWDSPTKKIDKNKYLIIADPIKEKAYKEYITSTQELYEKINQQQKLKNEEEIKTQENQKKQIQTITENQKWIIGDKIDSFLLTNLNFREEFGEKLNTINSIVFTLQQKL